MSLAMEFGFQTLGGFQLGVMKSGFCFLKKVTACCVGLGL